MRRCILHISVVKAFHNTSPPEKCHTTIIISLKISHALSLAYKIASFLLFNQKQKTCITDRPINHQKHQITTPSTHSFYQQVDEIRQANIEEPNIKHSQTHSCITRQPFDTAKVPYKSPFCLYSGTLYIKFKKSLT